MRFIFIFILLLISSCSSTSHKFTEYDYDIIKSKETVHYDAYSKTQVWTSSYINLPYYANKYLESGLINKDDSLSCFKDGKSVNYIRILNEYIPSLRPYVIEIQKDVNFNIKSGFNNSEYASVQKMTIKDNLQVKTKMCFKEIDGGSVNVISEKYSQNGIKL